MESIPSVNPNAGIMPKPILGPLAFAWLSLVVIFFGYQILGGIVALAMTGMDMHNADPTSLRTATVIGQIVFLLVPTIAVAAMARRILLEESFSMRRALLLHPAKMSAAGFAALGALGIQALSQGWGFLQSQAVSTVQLPEGIVEFVRSMNEMLEGVYNAMLTTHSAGEFAFVLLVVAVVPAISEELLFRGLFQQSLRLRLSTKTAIVLSGVTFALFHFNIVEMVPLVTIGIFLAFLAERTGSVFVPIAAHFTNNAFAATAVYLFGMETVNAKPSPSDAPMYLLLALIGAALLIVSLKGIIKVSNSPPVKNESLM